MPRDDAAIAVQKRPVLKPSWSLPPHFCAGTWTGLESAAFSPDGTQVVNGVWGRGVGVHGADGTGAPVVRARRTKETSSSAAFRPDGTQVVTASGDSTARVWRADGTGAPVVRDPQSPRAWAANSRVADQDYPESDSAKERGASCMSSMRHMH